MAEINLDECTATFKLKPHYSARKRLFTLTGKATHPSFGEVAVLDGYKLTHRYAWKNAGDFVQIMDAQSSEMMRFSTGIFDSDINLLPWLLDGGRRSGTGCWDVELNHGEIVYIKEIKVNEELRRRGVGTWFLQQLLKSPDFQATAVGGIYFFCWPAVVGRRYQRERSDLTNEHIVAFYQKNGFRRIGRTSFLCYSPDPNHPSHAISPADDATLLETAYGDAGTLSNEELESQFPLHVKVATVKTAEIASLIRFAHNIDPAYIHKKSLDGLTITHLAAAMHNVHALRTLLELGVSDELVDADNNTGMTPFEALQESMRSTRLFAETFGMTWNGYSDEEITCQYLLQKAENKSGLLSSEAEYIAKNKLGCTCGQCLDGWLSARMRFLLSVTAIFIYDMGRMQLSDLHGRNPKETYLEQFSMRFVPPAQHALVNKRFCQSWYQTFRAIHQILKAKRIPYPAQVRLHPDGLSFVMNGGHVENVLDAILRIAKNDYVDGSHEDTYGEDIDDIPSCANDSKFGFVRQKLGLDSRQRWGPYYAVEDDEEMMDEDDDDFDEDEDDEDDD